MQQDGNGDFDHDSWRKFRWGSVQRSRSYGFHRQFLQDTALFVEFAGKHERIVIESEPGILGNGPFFPVIFHGDRFKRKIVVCHDPQRIEVGVRRQQVHHVQCLAAAGFQLDNLESPVMPAGKNAPDARHDLDVAINQLEVPAFFQCLIIYRPKSINRASVGAEDIFPFFFLDDMFGFGKSQAERSGLSFMTTPPA